MKFLLLKKIWYRILIISISVLNKVFGKIYPRFGERLRYLRHLLEERRYATFFNVLFRFASKYFPFLENLLRLKEQFPSRFYLDARNQRLGSNGTIISKPSLIFRSHEAQFLLSVVIPCHNAGDFLPDAVMSVLKQTTFNIEIIIVDDGSTDNSTIKVIDGYADSLNLKVSRQENRGICHARNAGISIARGEYICCLDANDTIEPTYLEKCVAMLEGDRSAGFSYSYVQLIGDETEVWKTKAFCIDKAIKNNQTPDGAVFRRDDWQAVGGYNTELDVGYGDWQFWLCLAQLGRNGRLIAEPLYNHRRHGHAITHDAQLKRTHLSKEIKKLNPGLFKNKQMLRRLGNLPFVPHGNEQVFHKLGLVGLHDRTGQLPHMLVIIPAMSAGGTEYLLLDLLEYFSKSWRISIITTEKEEHVLFEKFARVTPEIYHLDNFLDETQWRDFAEAIIGSRGTKLVLSSNSAFSYDNLGLLKRLFADIQWIDILHNALPGGHLKLALKATSAIDRHITVDETAGQSLQDGGVVNDRISVIANGIDAGGLFNPENISIEKARAKFGLPKDSFVLTYAGRLSFEKGPMEFLNLISEVRKGSDVVALMAGSGPMEDKVDERIQELGLGEVVHRQKNLMRDETPALYAATDMLVITSKIEGLPLVMLEALSMGCPVASTIVGDVDKVIRDGENGLLAPSGKTKELAQKIKHLIVQPKKLANLNKNARTSILKSKFKKNIMLTRYEQCIQLVVNEAGYNQRKE